MTVFTTRRRAPQWNRQAARSLGTAGLVPYLLIALALLAGAEAKAAQVASAPGPPDRDASTNAGAAASVGVASEIGNRALALNRDSFTLSADEPAGSALTSNRAEPSPEWGLQSLSAAGGHGYDSDSRGWMDAMAQSRLVTRWSDVTAGYMGHELKREISILPNVTNGSADNRYEPVVGICLPF